MYSLFVMISVREKSFWLTYVLVFYYPPRGPDRVRIFLFFFFLCSLLFKTIFILVSLLTVCWAVRSFPVFTTHIDILREHKDIYLMLAIHVSTGSFIWKMKGSFWEKSYTRETIPNYNSNRQY